MIKIKNDSNEAMTKGWFREEMRRAIGEFAMIVNKSFVGVESHMGGIENRIEKLEKYTEGRFDDVFRELKIIREDIRRVDTRAEVLDLQARITKIER